MCNCVCVVNFSWWLHCGFGWPFETIVKWLCVFCCVWCFWMTVLNFYLCVLIFSSWFHSMHCGFGCLPKTLGVILFSNCASKGLRFGILGGCPKLHVLLCFLPHVEWAHLIVLIDYKTLIILCHLCIFYICWCKPQKNKEIKKWKSLLFEDVWKLHCKSATLFVKIFFYQS